MSVTQRVDGSIFIEEYTFVEWLLEVQKAVQDGYVVSLENNNYPSYYSAPFTVGMVKADEDVRLKASKQAVEQQKDESGSDVPETAKKPVAKRTTPKTAS